jgi:hypothetical protein
MFSSLAERRRTYGQRRASYKRREQMLIWVGAGVGGLLILIAGDLTAMVGGDKVPPLVIALALTFALLSAAAIGLARMQFEWAWTELDRKITEEDVDETREIDGPERGWPVVAELAWLSAQLFVGLAAMALLLGVWWAV